MNTMYKAKVRHSNRNLIGGTLLALNQFSAT
jgi:hypothetical protein